MKAGAKEGTETELLNLVDYELKPCEGCKTCFNTKKCVIEDDVEKIYQKIVEADGVIIGSPVYFYNVTAQTKLFIDRVGYLHAARGRKAFEGKIGGAVAVAQRSGLMSTVSQILMFFHSTRMIIATPFIISLAEEKGEARKDTRGLKDAEVLGKKISQIITLTKSSKKISF